MCILCAAAAASYAAAQDARMPSPAPAANFIVASFVRPVLFSVAGINIYSYGLLVAAALGLSLVMLSFDLARARIDLDEIQYFFVFLLGFAGGSKGHLALSAVGAGEELTWKALDIRSGHSFMGSQIGAVLCTLVYIRYHRVGTLAFLDVLLPCCLLGHTIGKVGCFLSGDGCYGPPADPARVPWAMSFPNGQVPTRQPVHPTPIYEGACSLLVSLMARQWAPLPQPESAAGRRTAAVLVLYGVERVVLEQFRAHPPIELFFGLTEYQALAVAMLAIGLVIEVIARVRGMRAGSKDSSSKASSGKASSGKKSSKKKD